MFTDTTLITINIVCIVFMTAMLIILAAATRIKGSAGWAGVIVFASFPIILVNLVRDVFPEYFMFFVYPCYTFNLLLFPALWFFTQKQMDKSFRFTPHHLLHAIPALISLVTHIVYYAPLSAAQVEAEILLMQEGGKNLPTIINDACLYTGLIVYYFFIIRYARKRLKYLRDNFSDSDYNEIRWTKRILVVYICSVFVAGMAYAINPRTDTWVIPILNTVGMAYIVYCVLFHSTTAYLNRLPDAPAVADKPFKARVVLRFYGFAHSFRQSVKQNVNRRHRRRFLGLVLVSRKACRIHNHSRWPS
jgi:hypothetical protein